mgnify:CR=1 FL=1|jgi:hypothetical protein
MIAEGACKRRAHSIAENPILGAGNRNAEGLGEQELRERASMRSKQEG